jgi:hypothetical protein
MSYETEAVYISKKSGCSGLWQVTDRDTDIEVSLHDSEQEAVQSAINDGYLIS